MQQKFVYLLIVLCLPFWIAAQLASWPGVSDFVEGRIIPINGTSSIGLNAGPLIRGEGIQVGLGQKSFSSQNWTANNLEEAIARHEYISFSISPKANILDEWEVDAIEIDMSRDFSGPQICDCLTSHTGFITYENQARIFLNEKPVTEYISIKGYQKIFSSFDRTIEFRLYCYGAHSEKGNLKITDNIFTGGNIGIRVLGSSILPIQLVYFKAEPSFVGIELNWITAGEINNDYLVIEHSLDGEHFTALAKINGRGTTGMPHNYMFTDENPDIGLNFYRLKQVDFEGDTKYHDALAVSINYGDAITLFRRNHSKNIGLSLVTRGKKSRK